MGQILTVAFCDKDGHGKVYALGAVNSDQDRTQLIAMATRGRDKYVAEYPKVQMNPEPVFL